MKPLAESNIETFAIEELQKQGYEYIFGPVIAPDGEHPERQSYSDVVLIKHLRLAIHHANRQ